MADLPDYYTQAQISEAEAAKFKGGLDANKSTIPVSRDTYLATDTHKLYICIADGAWTGFDASILTQGILTLYADVVGGGFEIKSIKDPTAAQSAATRAYALAQIAVHAALTATHGVAGIIAGLADIATHAALTATHGVAGTIAGLADIATHSGLATGIHNVGVSIVASVANIATHAALTATHGVTGTIAGLADIVTYIATHAGLTTGVHGVTGAILGTTDTQSISNKTLAGDLAGGSKQITALDRSKYNETNLLDNGSFEVGDPPTGWTTWSNGAGTFTRSAVQVKIGSYSGASYCNSGFVIETYRAFTAIVGRYYSFGCWVWSPVASSFIDIKDTPGDWTGATSAPSDSAWHFITNTAIATSTTMYVGVSAGWPVPSDATAYFDGAILVEGDSCPAFSPKPAAKTELDTVDAKLDDITAAQPARALGSTYQNTGGKIRLVSASVYCQVQKTATSVNGYSFVRAYCDANATPVLEVGVFGQNVTLDGLATQGALTQYGSLVFMVPPSYYYKLVTAIANDGVTPVLAEWNEYDLH